MLTKKSKLSKGPGSKQDVHGHGKSQLKSGQWNSSLAKLVPLSVALEERRKENNISTRGSNVSMRFETAIEPGQENSKRFNKVSWSPDFQSLSDSCVKLDRSYLSSSFEHNDALDLKTLTPRRKKKQNASRTCRQNPIINEISGLNVVVANAVVRDFCDKSTAGSQLKRNLKESKDFCLCFDESRRKEAKKIPLTESSMLIERDSFLKCGKDKMKTDLNFLKKTSSRTKREDSENIEERRKLSTISVSSTNDLKPDSQVNLAMSEKINFKTGRSFGDSGLATKTSDSDCTSPFVSDDENQRLNNGNFASQSAEVDNLRHAHSDVEKFDLNNADNQPSSSLIIISQEKSPETGLLSAFAADEAAVKSNAQQEIDKSPSKIKRTSRTKKKKKSTIKDSSPVNDPPSRIIIVKTPKIRKDKKRSKKKSSEKSKTAVVEMASKQASVQTVRTIDSDHFSKSKKQKEREYSAIKSKERANRKKQEMEKNDYRERDQLQHLMLEVKTNISHKVDEEKTKKIKKNKLANGVTKTNCRKNSNEIEINHLTITQESNQRKDNKNFKKSKSPERLLKQNKSSSTTLNKPDDERLFREKIKKAGATTKKNKDLHQNVEEWQSQTRINPTEKTPKEARIIGTMNWHTHAPDITNSVRPDLRSFRKGAVDARMKTPSKRFVKRSISSDGSLCSSTSVSSDSAVSSFSGSSSNKSHSDGSPTAYSRHRYTNLSFSSEDNIEVPFSFSPASRPTHRRRASSISSCLQRPLQGSSVRNRSRNKIDSSDLGPTSRPKSKLLIGDDKATISPDNFSRPAPINRDLDQKFGKKTSKRFGRCIVAEGEGTNSPWHHHKLVLVSQKPDSQPGRKTCKAKSISAKSLGPSSANGEGEKRPQTIRDLYSLHNVLSNTQNGTVISGYRRSDGLRVAIKRISKITTTRWKKMNSKTVPLELALLCQVNEAHCSGVVQIVEWHETNEAFLLVMVRPHPAVDLYDYISKHKRIKEHVARHIIKQLVRALGDCISSGVLHRDVKLENVLLNPDTLETTLIDFGCGDYVRNELYNEFSGTPEYYPPEWFQRKQYDADTLTTWSIGVLLYSLLCGTLPFKSSQEIREKETSKFPGDIGRKARDLIGLLLQKNPRNRLQMNQILDHSWFSNSPKTISS